MKTETLNLPTEKERTTSSILMTVILISFSMFFATFFLGYLILRFNTPIWPPMGMERIPLTLPFAATVLLALSSFSYWLFEQSCKDLPKRRFLLGTIIPGLGFLGLQIMLWHSLKIKGIYAHSGIFGSFLYVLTGLHAAHIILGLLFLLLPLLLFTKKGPRSISLLKINNIGIFWHFLGLVWFCIFMGLFVF